MIRTTEQHAMDTVPDLVHQLAVLTADQPTTAEIEEAILISKAITRALFEWAAWRYAQNAMAAVAAEPVDDLMDSLTEAEFDRIEKAQVHPIFVPLLKGLAG